MILQNTWNYLPNTKDHTTENFESLATVVSEHKLLNQYSVFTKTGWR